MTASEELAVRIREALAGHRGVRELHMFGAMAFLVNGKVAVAASRSGLLLRCEPSDVGDLRRRGAEVAEMPSGRQMGAEWVMVGPELLQGDEDLDFWLGVALDYNRKTTPGRGGHLRGS